MSLLLSLSSLIARVVGESRKFVGSAFHDLTHPSRGTIPALDVLRSCAVLLVIFGHLSREYVVRGGENSFSKLPFIRNGWIGVDLFFVLSGFLIGKQLWRELGATRTIDLKRFLLRRGFRIWPLYFAFLIFAMAILKRGDFPFGRGWTDMVFLTNYINYGVVGGSWSLCTEEQFYILAPVLLILGASRMRSIESSRKYLVGLLILLPIIRAVIWWRLTGNLHQHDSEIFANYIYQPIHTHADGLVMGLLLANLKATEQPDKPGTGFLYSPVLLPLAMVVGILCWIIQHEILGFTGITLIFGAIAWSLLMGRRAWKAPFQPLVFYVISRLSYGMYLNHSYMQLRILNLGRHTVPMADRFPAMHNVATALLLTLASAAVAVVTYVLIEYPFLRLRGVLDRTRSAKVSGDVCSLVARHQTPDCVEHLGQATPRAGLSVREGVASDALVAGFGSET